MSASLLRPALPSDYQSIFRLLLENEHHRHLDWRDPLSLLGLQPFLVLERGGQITAALACPPDPPGIAWLRLFTTAGGESRIRAWNELWNTAVGSLPEKITSAAISLHEWMDDLLRSSGFHMSQELVMLEKLVESTKSKEQPSSQGIRPMLAQDLPAVAEVDAAAFPVLWQISSTDLQRAHLLSIFATVVEDQGRLLGYQISTRTSVGLHLARLAVHPAVQGKGIGHELVQDLFWKANQQGIKCFTVNTQGDNSVSLSLYGRLGFTLTGEKYPVFTWSQPG
jgi:[ribosomal protein S18]-alanine N-acetyltransferase